MQEELISAVKAGNADAVRQQLAAGADINARDGDGATLLMLAAHAGDLAMVQLLIKGGADVNAADERGWTALSKAVYSQEAERGFADVVQALVDAGGNVEAAITYGVRPLMLAAGYGEAAVVEVLLKAGADVFAKNDGGYTAMMMVKQKHYVDVINLLHEAEQLSGKAACATKPAQQSGVITFMKRPGA